MKKADAIALLTTASLLDNFIQLNDATKDVWSYALRDTDVNLAKAVLREHYAGHVNGGPPPTIAPGMIRARAGEWGRVAQGRSQARSAAIEGKAREEQRAIEGRRPAGKSRFQEIMSQAGLHVKGMDEA